MHYALPKFISALLIEKTNVTIFFSQQSNLWILVLKKIDNQNVRIKDFKQW